jgi:iron complex outermembrane recepter protein
MAVTRRKRNILEMAVATAIFGACAAGAVPASRAAQATSTGDNGSRATSQTADQHGKKAKKQVANANLLKPVVINGFVSSLQNSIVIQKNADSIVEAVSAEQIGQLPGSSIANALGRLPGIATQMVNGRPQLISINGFGPDFVGVLLNGNEQVSTSNNRNVQLDQYPSSWSKVDKVYFTPRADLIGQGLAGTVDMQTYRPLAEKSRVLSLNANYQWLTPSQVMPGPGVDNKGYDVTGMYVDQFLDHTLGVTLSADLNTSPAHVQYQAPWGYATDANGNHVVGGSKNYNISDLWKRNAFLATIEYRPSSAYTSTLDMTYEDFNETQQLKGMEFPLAYGSGVTLTPGNVSDGFDQSGTYNNVYPVIRNDYDHYQARVFNVNWQNDFKFSRSWTGQAVASFNRAERHDFFLESYSGFGYDGPGSNGAVPPTTVDFSEPSDGELWLTSPQDFAASSIMLTDPQGWGAGSNLVQQGFINAPRVADYLANLKLSTTHYFENGPISSMEIGADRGARHKEYNIDQAFLVLPGAPCGVVISSTCAPTQAAPIPAGALEPTTAALGFMGIGPQVMYNPLALLASGAVVQYPTALSSVSVPPNWRVEENDTTGFLQFNIETTLGAAIGLRGNFGLQVAHTSQVSTGSRVAPGSSTGGSTATILIPTIGGTSYTRYLPSVNLVFSMPHDNDFRVSVARTMVRPRMDQMSASLDIGGNPTYLTSTNPNQSYFSGSGGNPKLLPYMATGYHASLEHYFKASNSGFHCNSEQQQTSALCQSGGQGYVQLAGYYYSLSHYINPNAAVLYNFSAYVPAYLDSTEQAQLGTTMGTLSAPDNTGSGHIEGLQLAINVPLGDFTRWLNGLGVQASADRTLSSVYYPGNTQPVTLAGLSKWVNNYTLYYAIGGFQASVNDTFRTSFLGRVYGISATRVEEQIKGQSWISAQLSYEFDNGGLKGLTIFASGLNLGNQVQQTFQNNDPRQVVDWERFGREFMVGFNYTLR